MTTKNKMIRTRLDDKTYKAFKELNDDLLIFEYTAVRYAVEYYLEKHGRMKEVPSQYRAVTGLKMKITIFLIALQKIMKQASPKWFHTVSDML